MLEGKLIEDRERKRDREKGRGKRKKMERKKKYYFGERKQICGRVNFSSPSFHSISHSRFSLSLSFVSLSRSLSPSFILSHPFKSVNSQTIVADVVTPSI